MSIYLEARPIFVGPYNTGFYHLYLVERDSPDNLADENTLAWRNSGSVLRGGVNAAGTGPLTVQSGPIIDSKDAYASAADLSNRLIWDITDLVGGDSAWSTLSSVLGQISAGGYEYELPADGTAASGVLQHVANSNATVFSLLNAVGVDARTVIGSYISGLTPGAGVNPTLLGQGLIEAASNIHTGVAFLGSNNGDDVFIGTGYGDTYYGPQTSGSSAVDTVSYANSSTAVTMTIDQVAQVPITVSVAQGTDNLIGIGKVILSPYNDTVIVDTLPQTSLKEVDGGGTSSGGQDILDLRPLGPSITFNDNKIQGSNTIFEGFSILKVDPGNDKVILDGSDDASYQEVDFGDGNDTLESNVINLKINLGSGTNLVLHAGRGSIIDESKGGSDNVVVSDDVLITGSTPTDQIFSPGHILLKGAVGEIGSEDPWIVGPDGTRYGLNQQGQLVIEDLLGDKTYVANYVGGPDVPFSQQTDGIYVGLGQFQAHRLLDLTRPFNDQIANIFKLGNQIYYTKTGTTIFHVDPLVFDLTGQGINLTSLMPGVAPALDMEGTGFAVNSGWVEPNDGILVLEQNGADGTPNISEMFGGPGATGFAALAQYDSNGDGVIDASDPIYSQLRIWVDSNGNGVVDPGELETLQQAGIASINLNATAQTGDTDNGNTIAATGTFTFTNGSTGNVDQVTFNADTYHSQYLGDTSVSTAAAAMPNLKGYGTLTNLQVAMTLDPSLIDVVNANLPNLDVIDLPSLRAAAMPIFTAWAEAVELPDANGTLQVVDPTVGNSDIAVEVTTDSDSNTTVVDYAYQYNDGSGDTYWRLASNASVYDADGNVIAQPTFAQVLAQPVSDGATWIDFSAAEIGFISRFYGQPFAIDPLTGDSQTPLTAMTDLVNGAVGAINLETVRLAMQGPLAQYFPGIAYNVTTDSFTATTQAELAPMYEAIFAAAPANAAGATSWLTQWLPIINIVLGDFARSNGQDVTYGYQFASMVIAYENSNLPLDIEDTAVALGVPSGEVIEGGSSFTGPNSPSIYYLHGGDQTVTAGIGLNNFVMGGTFGHDTIIDDEPVFSGNDPSILRFTNVASTGITATRDGLDLVLSVNGTDEQVTVKGEFTGVRLSFNGANQNDNVGVAQIAFSDGVLWDMPDIAQAVSRPEPTDPTILGTPGDRRARRRRRRQQLPFRRRRQRYLQVRPRLWP